MDFGTWPRLLVVDVEGNGATPPEAVEVALLPFADGQPDPQAVFSTLIQPVTPISRFVTRIHGITNDDVAHAPRWDEAGPKVAARLGTAWIAAHSAATEYSVLRRHLPHWQPTGVLDTLRLARRAFPTADGYSLDALLQHIGIDTSGIDGQRHRAAFDAHLTALLLREIAATYPSWDALIADGVPPGKPGTPTHEGDTLW
ncbi:3'-5' exonuclease [Amycolatopsis sp. 195334CR]|uniref:3'-5' exonuclease n=1 Tax=Amycolatopsis sp. 195334CR TaxID=2814588 RepID=UPI001A8D2348|nr:3'-5' exonuclease [Amycolatopsis sp. 195334CR]MBN6034187.1 3'-5' exonuclease [Amycolatopsis sp. 195334CR]